MHRKSHLELEKATKITMPEMTKVRRLLKSLKSTTMAVPIATIRAQDNLRGNFDATVNYLRSFISTIDHETRNVSQVQSKPSARRGTRGSNKRKGGSGGGSTDSKSVDRWYKPDEWFKLDSAKREQIIQARKKRKVSKVKSSREDESEVASGYDSDSPGGATSQRTSKVTFAPSTKKAKK
jgi:hypothetical protein